MRTPAPWLAALLVVAAVAPAPALAAVGAGAVDDTGTRFQIDGAEGAAAPSTTVEISLRADRAASWRVETHYALGSGNETRAFRTLADRYESGDADVGPDVALFETLQRRATESTGREMAIENVTYRASVDEAAGQGTLALTFRWSNFLRAGDNGTLVLDDAFELPTAEEDRQRTWLSIFNESQQIRIRPPEGYTVTSTSIPVQQRESAVVLAQPSEFEDDAALRITYSSVGPTDRLPVGVLVGAGVVAAIAVVSGTWLFRHRDDGAPPPDDVPAEPGDGPGPADGDDGEVSPERSAADATPGADGDDVAPDDSGDADGIDPSLLSDEERIERLLERNNGRMKQAMIVDEIGWSDAKVSQVLSAMAEEGKVDKLRLGRENLISFPDDSDAEE